MSADAGADGAPAGQDGSTVSDASPAPAPAPAPAPSPRSGAAIWHCWGKSLWWPAYVLDGAEVPENMRNGRVDEEGKLLTDTEVPLYYYGTHNYFWEKRSRLNGNKKRWRAAEWPPPARGDREKDPDLDKALQAHELQLKHNELLQQDFEYEEERAEQLAAEQEEVMEEIWIAPKDPKKPKRPGSAYTLFCGKMTKLPAYKGGGFGQHASDISRKWKALPESKKARYRDQISRAWDEYRRQMNEYKPLPLQRIVNPTEQQKKKFHKQIRKAPTKRKRQEMLQEAADSIVAASSKGFVAVAEPSDGDAAPTVTTMEEAAEEATQRSDTSTDPPNNAAQKIRRKKTEAGVKRARSAYNFFSSETVRHLAVTQQGKSMAELSKLVGPEWRKLSAEERLQYDEMASADRERYAAELQIFTKNKEEALRRRKAERAAEDEIAKQRKLAIKKFSPMRLNKKQNLLLAIEEMRVYQEATLSAAEQRKANRAAARAAAPQRAAVMSEKPVYQAIRTNNYLCQKPPEWKERAAEGQVCQCEVDSPCVDDSCFNRAIYWECDKTCGVGDACQNHRFQKRQYADVKPFKTEWKGWGLKAANGGIIAGAFVMEYVGEVMDVQQCETRLKEYKNENRPLYLHVLNDSMVIDAGVKGNMARFINHSCEPNCTTIRWVVHGEDRIGIFALRDIADGEEITIDYSWSPSQVGDQPCYCGTSSCTGFIGEKAFYDFARQGNLHGKTLAKKAMSHTATQNGLAAKDDECFVCRGRGSVICCDVPICSKVYHRGCLDPKYAPEAPGGASVRGTAMKRVSTIYMNGHMSADFVTALDNDKARHWHKVETSSESNGGATAKDDEAAPWRCPWHFCNECSETAVKGCAKCPTSFCHSHGNADGELVPFAVAQQGKRLQKVHTYKSAAEQDNQRDVDQAASAGRHGGVMLCRQCVERGYDRDGERVWAKVKGYPWWPATIRCEETSGRIRNHLGRIFVHFAKGGEDDKETFGWCTLKEIMDFEEGYESLRDAIPYPAKTASAKSMNQWYKRAVKDAWDELHECGTADQNLGAASSVPIGRSVVGAGASVQRLNSACNRRGGKCRGRASTAVTAEHKPKHRKRPATSTTKPTAKVNAESQDKEATDPGLSEAIRRSLSPRAQVAPKSKRQRGEAAHPSVQTRTRRRA